MNILLVGNGCREHALAEALTRNGGVTLFSAMGGANPGIGRLSKDTLLGKITDAEKICSFAQKNAVDFAVFGPEAPLVAGVSDALGGQGIPSFGPAKKFAQLEGSKGFTRALMKKYSIPGMPQFRHFTSSSEIEALESFIKELGECVVKADGVMGGKGVKVWGDHLNSVEEAVAWAKEIFASGTGVVVEEKLLGEEFSLQSITDGETLLHTPPVQDHKRAFEGDKGGNTGGMGSYSCEDHSLPFLSAQDLEEAKRITEKVLPSINKELGGKYVGVMYGGFMATAEGVKLIEYNARFGDPETMNTVPLIKNDFALVCKAAVEGKLSKIGALEFAPLASVCRYFVPEGYPDKPESGKPVFADEQQIAQSGAKLYYGSVQGVPGSLLTASSRTLAIMATGSNLAEAERKATAASQHVKGSVFCRKDIGTAQLVQKRVEHMRKLRENE